MHTGTAPLLIAEVYTSHSLRSTQLIVRNTDGVTNLGWSVYWFTIGI